MWLPRLVTIALAAGLLLGTGAPAMAHSETVAPAPPPEGEPPSGDDSFADAYSGPSFSDTHGSCEAAGGSTLISSSTESTDGTCLDGFEWRVHQHFVDNQIKRYNGYYHYHVAASCTGPCTITKTITKSRSNKYGFNIGFSVGPLNGATSWDLTASHSYSVSWALQVPAGRNMQMQFNDLHDVKVYNIHTDYIDCPLFMCYTYEVRRGTGWGAKFSYRHVFLNNAGA